MFTVSIESIAVLQVLVNVTKHSILETKIDKLYQRYITSQQGRAVVNLKTLVEQISQQQSLLDSYLDNPHDFVSPEQERFYDLNGFYETPRPDHVMSIPDVPYSDAEHVTLLHLSENLNQTVNVLKLQVKILQNVSEDQRIDYNLWPERLRYEFCALSSKTSVRDICPWHPSCTYIMVWVHKMNCFLDYYYIVDTAKREVGQILVDIKDWQINLNSYEDLLDLVEIEVNKWGAGVFEYSVHLYHFTSQYCEPLYTALQKPVDGL